MFAGKQARLGMLVPRHRLDGAMRFAYCALHARIKSSLPGLTRQSIHLCKKLFAKKMDARVTSAFTRVFDALLPAHDLLDKHS